jgi:hypothetical protein
MPFQYSDTRRPTLTVLLNAIGKFLTSLGNIVKKPIVSSDRLAERLVIVNFSIQGVDWEAAIRQARALDYSVLAFGSHVDLEAQTRARQAGASRVVANSRFASDMPGLVRRLLDHPTNTPVENDESADAE